jgi:hypothetical protein
VVLVSSSRSSPLRFMHNLHSRNLTGSLTVYHHPRSSGCRDPVLSCHQSLGIRIMSWSFCSIVDIRLSVLSSRVCVRDRWVSLVHPLTDARNRMSVSGCSSSSERDGSTTGISSIPVMLSTKCNPTVCRLSDRVCVIILLFPFVHLGGGVRSTLFGIVWQVPHGPHLLALRRERRQSLIVLPSTGLS